VRRYVYDGPNLVLEVNGSGTKLREYTHFPGIDRPHSMFDGSGSVYYYATDFPGHVTGLFNASGTVANRYRFSVWGDPELTSESASNSLRFMGRELDSSTALYYVRNRWYDAVIDRFVTEDPIGLNGGINLYAYASNNPTGGRDPYGLCQEDGSPTFLQPVGPQGVVGIGIEACKTWQFNTPREQGRNANPSGRGSGLSSNGDGSGTGASGAWAAGAVAALALTPEPLLTKGTLLVLGGAGLAATLAQSDFGQQSAYKISERARAIGVRLLTLWSHYMVAPPTPPEEPRRPGPPPVDVNNVGDPPHGWPFPRPPIILP
jgi:RHS repeat-associated protein